MTLFTGGFLDGLVVGIVIGLVIATGYWLRWGWRAMDPHR
jgi:hypothetical protein